MRFFAGDRYLSSSWYMRHVHDKTPVTLLSPPFTEANLVIGTHCMVICRKCFIVQCCS